MALKITQWLTELTSTLQDTLITDEQPLVVEQLILRLRRSKASITKIVEQLRTPKLLNQFLATHPMIGLNDNEMTYERGPKQNQEDFELGNHLTAMHSHMIQLSKDMQIHISACIDRLHIMSVNFNMEFATPLMPQHAKDLQQQVPELCAALLTDLNNSKAKTKTNIDLIRLDVEHAQDVYECFSQIDAELDELKRDVDVQVKSICATLARMAN
jgi:hypothetical protein